MKAINFLVCLTLLFVVVSCQKEDGTLESSNLIEEASPPLNYEDIESDFINFSVDANDSIALERNEWKNWKYQEFQVNTKDTWKRFWKINSSHLQNFEFRLRVKSTSNAIASTWECCGYKNISAVNSQWWSWKEMVVTKNDVGSGNFIEFWGYTQNQSTKFYVYLEYRYKSSTSSTNWELLNSGGGIKLFKKKNKNAYIQEIDLSLGAGLRLGQGTNTSASNNNPSPKFKRRPFSWYWQNRPYKTKAVTNCQFFEYNGVDKSSSNVALSFGLKDNGKLVSTGSWNNQSYKLKLGIDHINKEAFIANYNLSSYDYNSVSSNFISPLVIAGFHPLYVSKNKLAPIGRTMVGIRDKDGDGKNETVYIITATGSQKTVYDYLKKDFNCTKVIMLDGHNSTQLNYNNQYFYSSNRYIPSVLYTISK